MASSDTSHPEVTSSWEGVLRLALLGVHRTVVPLQWQHEATSAGLAPAEAEPEQVLLALAGWYNLLERAAPTPNSANVPHPAPAEPEMLPICPWRSLRHLEAILQGEYAQALPEFVQLVTRHQLVLPPEWLPDLLDHALDNPALWPQLRLAAGQRGQWLARQHPRWQNLEPTPWLPQSHWDQLSLPLQVSYLEGWRRQAPSAARQTVAERWPDLPPKVRVAWLRTLATSLSQTDEDFLEYALDDPRQEVRLVAAELLGKLPAALYLTRLFNRAATVIELTASGELRVDYAKIPDDKASLRDGIRPTGAKAPGGLAQSWLQQHLARIPPYRWSAHWEQSPESLIAAWARLPAAEVWQRALAEALLCHPHPDWTAALLTYWLESGKEAWWNHPATASLVSQLPAETYSQLAGRALEKSGGWVPANSLLQLWLNAGEQPWSAALTRAVLQGFQSQIVAWSARTWDAVHYQRLFAALAYRAPAELWQELRASFTHLPRGASRWYEQIDKIWQIMAFRKEMKDTLAKPTP